MQFHFNVDETGKAGIAALWKKLCDINSVSDNEAEISDFIVALLSKHGWKERDDWTDGELTIFRDETAVVARTNFGLSNRVVIAGHIDTVPISPLTENFPTRWLDSSETIDGEPMGKTLWGRGTCDMKGGLAANLAAALEVGDNPGELDLDVTFIFYDHEEVDAIRNGMGRLARNHPVLFKDTAFGLLGEPSLGQIKGGCNGTLRFNLIAHGVTAHTAYSYMGSNAIHNALPILQKLSDYVPAEIEVDGLVYREGLNAVFAEAGIASNMLPPVFKLHSNFRFAPSRSVEEAKQWVVEYFGIAGSEGAFEIEWLDESPGARPGLTSALALEFVDIVRQKTGTEPSPKFGWTDVARLSELGIPSVNFGPAEPALCHHDEERCALSQVVDCYEILVNWLLKKA